MDGKILRMQILTIYNYHDNGEDCSRCSSEWDPEAVQAFTHRKKAQAQSRHQFVSIQLQVETWKNVTKNGTMFNYLS